MDWLVDIKYRLHKWKLVNSGKGASCPAQTAPMTEPIDFVVTWVDGSDPVWLKEKETYERALGIAVERSDNGDERYRDWDVFRYWFRAVETYAPWVRNVYLVTCGQIPSWIDPEAPKLKIVNHSDFIPEKYLPTFSANPIELNLHRIEGLSEHFVYFNDDIFLGRPVRPEDFFTGGFPNYTAAARPLINMTNGGFEHMQFSTMGAINSHFADDISQRIDNHPEKWFAREYGQYYIDWNLHAYDRNYLPGMFTPHLGVACRKSAMHKVWEALPDILNETCLHRFRTPKDVIHQIFSIWEILEGNFHPVGKAHHGKLFSAQLEARDQIAEAIVKGRYRMICINDSEQLSRADYLELKNHVKEAFEKAFPAKSHFEKD